MKHFIAMSGLQGCLPAFCHSYETKQEAVESLAMTCDLTGTQRGDLEECGITDLEDGQGNDYAEVWECSCNTPEIHND